MKRIITVLAVAALMAMMLAAMAAPAFADAVPNARNYIGQVASLEVPELAGEDGFAIPQVAQEERDPLRDGRKSFIAGLAGNHCPTG